MTSLEFREDEPFTAAATSPFRAWRKHWVVGSLWALIGAVLGAAAGFLIAPTYTAEARVAVGAGDLTSGAIAGFPLAASSLASNYARYVNDKGVAGQDVPEDVDLSASQIPESNVIRIEASAPDPEAARAAANGTAQELVDAVNANDGSKTADAVYQQYTEAAVVDAAAQSEVAAAQHDLDTLLGSPSASKAKIKAARSDVADATAKAATADLQASALRQKYVNLVAQTSTAANLRLIRTADSLSSNQFSLIGRLGLLGLVIGGALGLLAVSRMERRTPAARRKEADDSHAG